MEFIDYSIVVLTMLLVVGFIAGFIDTLVGGGGLITIPALMMAGVPPIYALGTNKVQSSMGSGTAALMMLLRKKVALLTVWPLMLAAFVGSMIGSVLVQFIDASVLVVLIPTVITLIALYFLFSPNAATIERVAMMPRKVYQNSVVPSIGFYDGMFGPGTGSFFVLAGVSLRGHEIVSATATAKCLNFSTNFAAMMVFIYYAKVLWVVGLVMMIGQALGAVIGARTLLRVDPKLLRWLVIAMCIIMLVAWLLKL